MSSVQIRDGPQINADLDQFLKFFVQKAVQVIAQSRTGKKYRTKSNPRPVANDWFTLNIDESKIIHDEVRSLYANQPFREDEPICMEISLTTSEDNLMIVEIWSFTLNITKFDPNVLVRFTVYNRLGILLRSLLAVTRAVPAYYLARKHSQDVDLRYSLYYGEPQLSNLGEGYKTHQVGSVGTPGGYLIVSLAYRSKYFLDDRSLQPVCERRQSIKYKSIRSIDEDQVAGVTMTSELKDRITDELASAMADDPNGKSPITSSSAIDVTSTSNRISESPVCHSLPKTTAIGAFVAGSSGGSDPPNFNSASRPSVPFAFSSPAPFQSLLPTRLSSTSPPNREGLDDSMDACSPENPLGIGIDRSESFMEEDDFVMVDLNPAFATPTSTDSDLAAFYRECQSAPRLRMFDNDSALDLSPAGVKSIGQELERYKKLGDEFESSLGPLVMFE